MRTIGEILIEWLKEHGYSGLYDDNNFDACIECGCKLDDLMPCGHFSESCKPGYIKEFEGENGEEWLISKEKE